MREATARQIGVELYQASVLISSETVDAMSAVIARLAQDSDSGSFVARGFGQAMVADRAAEHLQAPYKAVRK